MKIPFIPSRLAILAMCAALLTGASLTWAATPQTDGRIFTRTVPAKSIVRTALSSDEAAATMNISVSLKMRNMGELQARINAGEHIAQNEMEERYLPLKSDYDEIATWLTSRGLSQREFVDTNHTNIFVRGTVAAIAQALNVQFAKVAVVETDDSVTEITSAVSEPTVPNEIQNRIVGIVGLQPHVRMKPLDGSATGIDLIGNIQMSPKDVNIVYNNTTNLTGAGQTIAIYGWATPTTSDITGYLSAIGSNEPLSNYVIIPIDGGSTPSDQTNNNVEGWGDLEMVLGIAPGAKVRDYEVADANESTSLVDVIAAVINDQKTDHTITVFTISSGTEESAYPSSLLTSIDQQFAQLAAAGVTVCVGSGDGGSNPGSGTLNDYNSANQLEAGFPASDPNVTSVGGTDVNFTTYNGPSNLSVWSEVIHGQPTGTSPSAWSGIGAASGGGLSPFFTRPSWQAGFGVPSGTQHCVPDLCVAWGVYQAYINGGSAVFGGTSASNPVFAGYVALINQARGNAGMGPVGLLGPKIYPLIGTAAFNDITQGTIGAYTAGPGYDLASGIGSPNFAQLVNVLTGGTLPTGPAPSVSITQDATRTVQNGSAAITLTASASTAANFQWYLNGVAITGATNDALTVMPTAATEGDYSVTATNSGGSASADAGILTVTTDAWIVNLSSRAYSQSGSGGANQLIAGFVTTGPDSKTLLIRGVGPTLANFTVPGFLPDPMLTLVSGSTTVASTSSWSASLDPTFSQVGAFSLIPGSHDTALLETLPSGLYTAQVISATSNNGVALAEVYDADNHAPTDRLINISARAFVGTGGNILIGGFVIGGNTPQTVIIRADGPALTGFGLTGALPNTTLTLSNSNGTIASNSGWGSSPTTGPQATGGIVIQPLTAALSQKVGGFALTNGSNDSAIVATLQPGAYTAQVAGANGATGVALVEIYELR
jgi:kumamolisin